MNKDTNEIMLDLLIKKATYGLDGNEEKQLADLEQQGGIDESLSFELTAASIGMIGISNREKMPVPLREKIAATAQKHFASQQPAAITSRAGMVVGDKPKVGSWFGWLGWGLAAAACLALAFNLFSTRPQHDVVKSPVATPTPEERLTPAQQRLRLIDTASDLARANWGPGKMTIVSPSGDVVWSDANQTGYMRLSGLPKNDPAKETYQLWIVAENQDAKTPVDGGTFDINSDGEVIIPINAKVKALNPQAFAITIEKPGGVPVSRQEKVPALAKRET